MKSKDKYILILLLILSSCLYLYNLGSYPPSVHCDEVLPVFYGRDLIQKIPFSLIGVSWFDIPNLVFIPYGIVNKMLGDTVMAVRFSSAMIGIMSVIVFYLLTKLLYSKKVAFFSSLLFTTSHWWIASSRSGIINIQTVLPELLCFYFLFKAIKTERKVFAMFSGLFLGLGLYTYLNFRIVPILIFFYLLYAIITNTKKLKVLNIFLLVVLTAGLIYLPMMVHYIKNPDRFFSRSSITFIFSQDQSVNRHMSYVHGTNNRFIWLLNNTKKALTITNNFQDENWQYGYRGMPLDPLSLGFFFIGLVITLITIKKRESMLITLWFVVSYVVLGILTINIALPRLVGLLPVLYIFIGIGMTRLYEYIKAKIQSNNRVFLLDVIFLVLVVIITIVNINTYFFQNQISKLPIFYKNTETKIAEFLRNNSKKYTDVFFFTEPYILPDWCLISLYTPHLNSISLKSTEPIPKTTKPAIFIVLKQYVKTVNQITLNYPQAYAVELGDAYAFLINSKYENK